MVLRTNGFSSTALNPREVHCGMTSRTIRTEVSAMGIVMALGASLATHREGQVQSG